MKLEDNIKEILRPLVEEALARRLEGLKDDLLELMHQSTDRKWGRYLSYDETAEYLGLGSKKDLKKRLAGHGIDPIEINERVKLYDRKDLDRLKIEKEIKYFKL